MADSWQAVLNSTMRAALALLCAVRRQLEAIGRLAVYRQPDSPFEQLLRYSLVGCPNAHYIVSLPPLWVRDAAWRADVRALLAQLEGLNASQKR